MRGAEIATHIARHDPQSVLARVEAERALVALHQCEWYEVPDVDGGIPWNAYKCTRCDQLADDEDGWPCQTLRALASGYRHRERFDPAWVPGGAEVGT